MFRKYVIIPKDDTALQMILKPDRHHNTFFREGRIVYLTKDSIISVRIHLSASHMPIRNDKI